MKRSLLLVAFLAFMCSVSAAQFGVRAGLSLATFSGEGIPAHMRGGFAGGVLYDVPLGSGFYLQPEVLYVQKGYQVNFSGGDITSKYDYLDIPVVVRWGPMPLSFFDSFIEVGLSYGVLLSAKDVNEQVNPTVTTDVKDQMASGDLSFVLGGGANFRLFSRDMRLSLRFVKGTTKIFKATPTVPQPDITNTTGIFGLEVII